MCLSVVSEVEPYAVRIARTVPGGVRTARCAPTRPLPCKPRISFACGCNSCLGSRSHGRDDRRGWLLNNDATEIPFVQVNCDLENMLYLLHNCTLPSRFETPSKSTNGSFGKFAEIRPNPLRLKVMQHHFSAQGGDEGPFLKGGKAVKVVCRGGHQLCTSAARKIGRKPRSSNLYVLGDSPPNQTIASAPKATKFGQVQLSLTGRMPILNSVATFDGECDCDFCQSWRAAMALRTGGSDCLK